MLNIKELQATINIKEIYQEPEITAPCHSDVMLLQNDYAAKNSETTAVLTYIYQSYIIKTFNEDLAKLVEKIAIQEMRHHELLGGMIVKLGGTPIIADNSRYWYGGFINYTKNLQNMMFCNIKAEEEAIKGYLFTIDKLRTRSIVPLIQHIIEEERHHIEIFKMISEMSEL